MEYYLAMKNNEVLGLPWQSSGYDSTLPLQGVWVRSLVKELRSHMPCHAAWQKIIIIMKYWYMLQYAWSLKKIAKKANTKGHMLYDFIYIKFPE